MAAESAAVTAPSTASSRKWLAVTTITKVISNGYSNQKTRATRQRTRRARGHPIISANATCIEGMAANGLNSELLGLIPVRYFTLSVKPHSGSVRGGAVGNAV